MKVETINNPSSSPPPPDDDASMTGRPVVVSAKEMKATALQVKRMRLEDSGGSDPKVMDTIIIDNAVGVVGGSAIVELNVGGEVFVTNRQTLLQSKSPFFERLLAAPVDENGGVGGDSGWVQVPAQSGTLRDAHNRLFLDRSPDLFRSILEFLRTGFIVTPQDPNEKQALLEEAQHYQLEHLVERIKFYGGGYDPFCLSAADAALRAEAMAIRQAFRNEEPDAAVKATELLVDIFDPITGKLTIQADWDRPCTSIDATVLFQKQATKGRKGNKALPSTLEEFQSRFKEVVGPFMRNFPLGGDVFVAGGSVLSALVGTANSKKGDVDLFLVAPDAAAARKTYDRILEYFADPKNREGTGINHKQLLVVRGSRYAVTLFLGLPQKPVQIILTYNSCAAQAIFNFDIDCCQVVYDGTSVKATPTAIRALTTGINFADPERRSITYEIRLAKYAERGFAISVPGLDLARVATKYLRNGFFSHYAGGGLREVKLDFSKPGVLSSVSVGPEEVTGLAKLLVYANRYDAEGGLWDPSGQVRLRSQQAYVSFGYGSSSGNDFGNNTYLIEVEKLMNSSSGAAQRWTNPTPPFPPPQFLIQAIEEKEDSSGKGGPLLVNKPTPEEVKNHLVLRLNFIASTGKELPVDPYGIYKSDNKDYMSMPPLCAWDYFFDVKYFDKLNPTGRGGSSFCRVLDAGPMYPFHDFTDDTFPRHLAFLSSNQRLFGRMNASGWTDAVYAPLVCLD